MIDELKQLQAVDYAMDDLDPRTTAHFQQELDHNPPLVDLVRDLQTVAASLVRITPVKSGLQPSEGLLQRIEARLNHHEGVETHDEIEDGIVLTGLDGKIAWVNDAFTQMCGFELPEIIGKKPGTFLQGDLTNCEASDTMRRAVHGGYGCMQELINYHKNGEPYWVRITISPISDETGKTSRFVAIERKLKDRPMPVAA